MKIKFIGIGSAFNHKLGSNSALIGFNGTNLLLDCGHDIPYRLEKLNIDSKIKNIWISHLHADHVGGIEEMLFKSKFKFNNKINIMIHEDNETYFRTYLNNSMLAGTGQFIDDYANIIAVKDSFNIQGEIFNLEKTNHINGMPSHMIIGNDFIFTSDSKVIDYRNINMDNIKYIFHDTQLNSYPNNVHATLDELLSLPEEIREKIYCMHWDDDYRKPEILNKIKNGKMNIPELVGE